MRDAMLADFDHEMAVTRQVLERVPETAFDWRPHEKSFTLGGLATHLAQLPRWGTSILNHDSYDVGGAQNRTTARTTRAEVLDIFDQHVSDVRRRLVTMADQEFLAPWTLTKGGTAIFSMPKLAALKRFLLHHVIHHRGQMTVYLRLQGVPLPPIYGPTADEAM